VTISKLALPDKRTGESFSWFSDGWDLDDNLKADGSAPNFEDWKGFNWSRIVFSINDCVVSFEAKVLYPIVFITNLGFIDSPDAHIPNDMLTRLAEQTLQRWPRDFQAQPPSSP